MANQVTRCPNAVLQSPNAAQIVDGPSLVPLPPQKNGEIGDVSTFFFTCFKVVVLLSNKKMKRQTKCWRVWWGLNRPKIFCSDWCMSLRWTSWVYYLDLFGKSESRKSLVPAAWIIIVLRPRHTMPPGRWVVDWNWISLPSMDVFYCLHVSLFVQNKKCW